MLVLEHDAKELLHHYGLAVPRGVLIEREPSPPLPVPPPWMVKAQVKAGGRFKAGGIRRADSEKELQAAVSALLGSRIGGQTVRSVRVEENVSNALEAYLSVSLDPASLAMKILLSAGGGVDVEAQADVALLVGEAAPDHESMTAEITRLAQNLPPALRHPVSEAAIRIASICLDLEATLVEINPLFVRENGSWCAGDAKVIADANALPRQPLIRDLVNRRREAYADIAFKLEQGFDFVILDPDGEVGLVTTGAGLSMQLVDEMRAAGVRPYNFCDLRTGQMHGDPSRLIGVLGRIADGARIRAVLVNVFAGITDLNAFAALLLRAIREVPQLDVPIVARLVGNGEAAAASLIRGSGLPILLENDLERAVAMAVDTNTRGVRA